MFSLIIVIISIALVAALAFATIYFGGSAFSDGKGKADAGRVLNEAQQLDGAIKIYQTDNHGALPSSITELVTKEYLKAAPSGQWEFQTDYVVETGLTADACKKANEQLYGANDPVSITVPLCSTTEVGQPNHGKTICCQE